MEAGLGKESVTVWLVSGVNGASHMWRSSLVMFTPSSRLVATLGSLEYSGNTLILAGLAEIYRQKKID